MKGRRSSGRRAPAGQIARDIARGARDERGFTLIEILVVIAIIGLIVSLVGPRVLSYLSDSKVKAAKMQIDGFASALDLFFLDNGRYPTSNEGLTALVQKPNGATSWNGPYLRTGNVPNDPWTNPYSYRSPGQHGAYDIVSLGSQGREGGTGSAGGDHQLAALMGQPSPGPCRVAAGRLADPSGFTLIEVVALMAILGLLLAVALPALPRAVSRPQMEAVALAVASILDGDHRAAMRRHQEVASIVDLAHRRVSSGAGGRSLALPAGIAITAVLAQTCLGAPVRDRIVFLPDGPSCGGALALDRAGQTVDIRVNWLTGATEIVSRTP